MRAPNSSARSCKRMGIFPGCGNYLEHDLEGAKRECAAYLAVLEAI